MDKCEKANTVQCSLQNLEGERMNFHLKIVYEISHNKVFKNELTNEITID